MRESEARTARPKRGQGEPSIPSLAGGALVVVVPIGYLWWEIGLSSLL